MTKLDWKSEIENIVDKYVISHHGNAQCKCIEGASGHLKAQIIDLLTQVEEEAFSNGYDAGFNDMKLQTGAFNAPSTETEGKE